MARGSDKGKRPRAAPEEPRPAAPAPQPEPAGSWVARDEPMTFPADEVAPEGEPGRRLSLPSSGLASDILALADAEALEASSPGPLSQAARPEPALRSHNISFFTTPVREERKAAEATEHLATFFLGREEYGVDVRLVQEIIRVGEITQVPRAPAFIKGVINLRGRIIPVVDLRRKLALGEVDERARAARVVVVKLRERLVGLLVDAASQVLKVPLSVIDQAPEEVVEIDHNFIRGVAKLDQRLIILMDLPRILALELREGEPAGA